MQGFPHSRHLCLGDINLPRGCFFLGGKKEIVIRSVVFQLLLVVYNFVIPLSDKRR